MNRRHFVRLHLVQLPHSGIIAYTFDPNFRGLALRIHEAVQGHSSLSGKLLRVNRPSS